MKLLDIKQPIHYNEFAQDVELVKEIQRCLDIQQTGVFGPTTSEALWRFAFDQYLDNAHTGLIGPTLATALLKTRNKGEVFGKALEFVLRWEGGYVNNPADRGGETNMGITCKTYNAYCDRKRLPKVSVRYIKTEEVQEIYKTSYWDAAGCDQMPPRLAIAVFDWQVNSGRGVKYLQECLGSKADGQFGAKTQNDLQVHLGKHGETKLLETYLQKREAAYRRWATGNQRQFLTGWLNRLSSLKQFLSQWKD